VHNLPIEKTQNTDLNYQGRLDLNFEEACLALHAIRAYISSKGAEVSDNTRLLESKLESYIEQRLGPQQLIVGYDK